MAGIEPASSGFRNRRAATALHPGWIRIRESNPVMWVTKPLLFPMSYSGIAGDRGVEPRPAGFGGPPGPGPSPMNRESECLTAAFSESGGMDSNHLPTGHESAASPFGFLQWGDQPDSHRYLRVHTPASFFLDHGHSTNGWIRTTSLLLIRQARRPLRHVRIDRVPGWNTRALSRNRTCTLRLRRPALIPRASRARRQRRTRQAGISIDYTAVTDLHPWLAEPAPPRCGGGTPA